MSLPDMCSNTDFTNVLESLSNGAQRNGSAVKSIQYSCVGRGFGSQHLCEVATVVWNSTSRVPHNLFQSPQALGSLWCTHKHKILNCKKRQMILWFFFSFHCHIKMAYLPFQIFLELLNFSFILFMLMPCIYHLVTLNTSFNFTEILLSHLDFSLIRVSCSLGFLSALQLRT